MDCSGKRKGDLSSWRADRSWVDGDVLAGLVQRAEGLSTAQEACLLGIVDLLGAGAEEL